MVPPRQFIRTSGGSWALPGAVFSGLGGILGGLGGVLEPLEGVLVSLGRLESFVGRLGRVLGRLGGVSVGNMAPTWFPKQSPNRSKIEAKINHFLNASWDLIFIGFCWTLKGKMEPSWHPDGINNRCQLRKIIFVENLVFPKEKQ